MVTDDIIQNLSLHIKSNNSRKLIFVFELSILLLVLLIWVFCYLLMKPIKAMIVVIEERTTLQMPVAVVAEATRVALGRT